MSIRNMAMSTKICLSLLVIILNITGCENESKTDTENVGGSGVEIKTEAEFNTNIDGDLSLSLAAVRKGNKWGYIDQKGN